MLYGYDYWITIYIYIIYVRKIKNIEIDVWSYRRDSKRNIFICI